MALKTNRLIPVGIFALFLAFVFLITRCDPVSLVGGRKEKNAGDADQAVESLTALSGQVSTLRKELQAMTEQSGEKTKQEAQNRTQAVKGLQQQVEEHLQQMSETSQQTIQALTRQIQGLAGEMKSARSDQSTSEDKQNLLPVEPAPGLGDNGVIGAGGYKWYRPVGFTTSAAAGADPGGLLGNISNSVDGLLPGSQTLPVGDREEAPDIPVYTVPENATLMGATAMTAMIGRVPLLGSVRNPVPFKLITGADNLTANDIVLPEVEKMIWSGYAIGDGTLKCVRGTVTSVTFIFRDGRIRTVREGRGGTTSLEGGLGWVSDERGYPCIPGKYVSNAPANMARMFFAGAAAGAGDAAAYSQTTVRTNNDGSISRTLTGDAGNYVAGRALGEGFREWSDYIAERARDSFDAVVLQPGHAIAINTSREIRIDYDPRGRKVRHVAAAGDTDPKADLD